MNNNNIKVGDVVIAIKEQDGNASIVGKKGRIIYTGNIYCTVEFFKRIDYGHGGNDNEGKAGYCWNIDYDRIKKSTIKYKIEDYE
jgi:hypothetical protein